MSKRTLLPLTQQLRLIGLPAPTPEYRFATPRRWRFDLAWLDLRLACEIEGGVFMRGGSRHSRGAGYEKDCEKYAEALIRGWRVLRVTTGMVNDGRALTYLERILR
jgi:very-short-patch-repair endonuclease